jgi:Ser/Thr protein kinase RdoA (MazF antagonist)
MAQRHALNPHWLKEQLGRSLWRQGESPGEIVGLHISQVRESRREMTAVYRLTLRAPNDQLVEQSYVGYVPRGNRRLTEDYRALAARTGVQPAVGRWVTLLPEANLIFVAYPNDHRMDLLSEDELKRRVQEQPPAWMNGAGRVEEARVTLLRYMPGKRATIRCRVRTVDAGGARTTWSCIAKQYADARRAEKLHRTLVALERAWAGSGPEACWAAKTALALRLPRALGLDAPRGIVFMDEVGGRDLSTLTAVDLETVLPAVGALLARFHQMPVGVCGHDAKRVSRESELAETREALAEIGDGWPDLRPRLQTLFGALSSASVSTEAREVLLHGSFRLNHVLLDEQGLTLLDLESLRRGHPAYDLANAISSLHYAEAEGRLAPDTRRRVSHGLLRGYAAAVPEGVDTAALLWFLACLLINKQAWKYVRHGHAERESKVQRMVALAEEAAAAASSNVPAREPWSAIA